MKQVWSNIIIKEEPGASALLIACAELLGFDGPFSRMSDYSIRAFHTEPAFALAGGCPFEFDPYKDQTFTVMIALALRMSAVGHERGVTVTTDDGIGVTALYRPHVGPKQGAKVYAFAVMTCAEIHFNRTKGIGPLKLTRISRLDGKGNKVA